MLNEFKQKILSSDNEKIDGQLNDKSNNKTTIKDSRPVTLNTKGSKYTTPITTNQNTYKRQMTKGKNTEDENTDNQCNPESNEANHSKSINCVNGTTNQDTVQIISMSQKNTPNKKINGTVKDKKPNNNDLYDLSEVDLSPMRDKSEKARKDFYGNAIIRRGKRHKITFIDFIKKGKLEDVVLIKKINENEESFEEIQKKNSDSNKKSVNSIKDKNKVEGASINVSKGNGTNEECSCACLIF